MVEGIIRCSDQAMISDSNQILKKATKDDAMAIIILWIFEMNGLFRYSEAKQSKSKTNSFSMPLKHNAAMPKNVSRSSP